MSSDEQQREPGKRASLEACPGAQPREGNRAEREYKGKLLTDREQLLTAFLFYRSPNRPRNALQKANRILKIQFRASESGGVALQLFSPDIVCPYPSRDRAPRLQPALKQKADRAQRQPGLPGSDAGSELYANPASQDLTPVRSSKPVCPSTIRGRSGVQRLSGLPRSDACSELSASLAFPDQGRAAVPESLASVQASTPQPRWRSECRRREKAKFRQGKMHEVYKMHHKTINIFFRSRDK